MASTSGRYRGPTADNGRVYVNWQLKSQSQSGNYSVIKWQFGWEFLGSPTDRQLDNGMVYIEGVRWERSGRVRDYPLNRGYGTGLYQVASGECRVQHDGAGHGSMTVRARLTGYSGAQSNGSNKKYTLPRIPKAPHPPGTPNLAVSGNTIRATWTGSETQGTGITHYQIHIAPNSNFSGMTSYRVNARSKDFTGLKWQTQYWFRVYAGSDAGRSAYSGVASARIGDGLPNAPGRPTGSNLSPIGIDLAWAKAGVPNGASAVSTYDLEVRAGSLTGTPTHSSIGNTDRYSVTHLAPSTFYRARVRARNSRGAGAWSGEYTFTTLPSLYVPNDDLTAWRIAVPYIAVNGVWVPARMAVPSGSTNGEQHDTPTEWV